MTDWKNEQVNDGIKERGFKDLPFSCLCKPEVFIQLGKDSLGLGKQVSDAERGHSPGHRNK